ncbi:MAG: ExeM/NucH family extracellular endonuclease [Anaerolineae bacterium]|nr:ExeM/NucH family extracellular endonuclease [Anaerolineae bacterium]
MHRKWFLFLIVFFSLFAVMTAVTFAATTAESQDTAVRAPLANDLRLSQVYGGGGNAGAPYTHDFIEIFNSSSTPISLDGLSLQYASATGTGNFGANDGQLTELPNVAIQPGQYYLVQQAGGVVGDPLPTPDHIDPTPINLSGTNGKVVLVTGITSLGCNGGSTPCDADQLARIIDLVGYGNANFFEGTAAAPVLSNTTAGIRNDNGCTDTDNNAADFVAGAPTPRNTGSPTHSCAGEPFVVETDPADGATNVPLNATIAITFSEAVTVTADWFDLTCTSSGPITGSTVPASPADAYTITPDSPFAYDEQCTVTILATEVSDSDGLTLTVNYPFTFSTESTDGDITFVYHDLEDVVQPGEAVYLAGDFNGWNPATTPLTADGASAVFSVTVPGLAAGDYGYKYIVYTDTVPSGPPQWDWLNTNNRSVSVSGNATADDYRHILVDWANLQWPYTTETDMGVATENIYGQLYINNVTNPAGEGRGLKAEVGYGADASPANWAWFPMSFNVQTGNNDEFVGVITPTTPGVFSYTTRYDGNWGAGNPHAAWTYASISGIPYDPTDTGVLTVTFASVPIADARAGSNGQIFALEGQVIATNNTWNNAPEWAFQDASGGIAAFFLADPPISLGDTVRMVATRGSFNNQEQMVTPLYFFDVVSAGPPVAPISYTTGQVANGDSEGWLIEIEGVVGNMPTSCGSAYNITLDDGSGAATVRIESATGINLCNLGIQNGDMLGVTGFSTQFQTTYQVKPRSVGDLHLFVDAPVVVGTTPTNNATNVLTDTVITIQFNEPVTVTAVWYAIQCSLSGVVSASSAPGGPAESYTITPDSPFASGDICHVTVPADQVVNGGGLNMLADYLFSFTVGPAPVFGVCGDTAVPIHFIQGDGLTTPIFGTTVVVEAVVVGSYQGTGQFSGFFLQERDDRADGDPTTSEGIFVFGGALASVSPGDLVRVRGTATEFNNLTQVASVSNLAVCDTGQTVTPATMALPVADMMAWEAVEGMLVAFDHDLVVTEHYNLGRYGELQLSVNDRLWNPTNLVLPGAPALALQELNNRSRIMLDDGLNTQNPDPVVYPDPGLTYTNTLRTGALVHNLMGVLDYRANTYRIQPVGMVDFSDTAVRPETPDVVSGAMRVASFNVLNYFTTLDTGNPICGPSQNLDCRGANTAFELERQRVKILNAILEIDADVIGLIEIENHVNDDAVLDLVAGLNDIAGAGTYAHIDTGTIGTDAIKQAFIYQPDRVTAVGDYVILDSTVDPRFLDTKNRPVLIQTFMDNGSGELVTVAVNHLKSKGSACDDVNDPDVGDGQGNCNLTRLAAVEALIDFLATDPTGSGSDRFLLIGDMNSYAMEDPIMALVDAGYTDLLRQFYGDAAYSYVFDGQSGHLDHALASASLLPQVTGATAWHINADEPRVLDYNVEFKSAQQIDAWFGPGPFRSSDHDPVIVGLHLMPVVVTPTMSILSPVDGAVYTSTDGTAVTIPVVITTTDFTIPDDGHWHLWLNGVDMGPVLAYETSVDLLPGTHVISAELQLPDHTPLGIVDTVTVTVVTGEPTEPTMHITSPVDGAEYTSVNGTAVTIPVVITTTDFTIPDDGHWHLWVDGVHIGPVLAYETSVDLLPGTHVISAELQLPDHTPLGIVDSVTVTVNATYGIYLPLIMKPAANSAPEASVPVGNGREATLPLNRYRAG